MGSPIRRTTPTWADGTLGPWVSGVYLRYSDAVNAFPDCWMWHPDVVEELLWLHRAWLSAYDPEAWRAK